MFLVSIQVKCAVLCIFILKSNIGHYWSRQILITLLSNNTEKLTVALVHRLDVVASDRIATLVKMAIQRSVCISEVDFGDAVVSVKLFRPLRDFLPFSLLRHDWLFHRLVKFVLYLLDEPLSKNSDVTEVRRLAIFLSFLLFLLNPAVIVFLVDWELHGIVLSSNGVDIPNDLVDFTLHEQTSNQEEKDEAAGHSTGGSYTQGRVFCCLFIFSHDTRVLHKDRVSG